MRRNNSFADGLIGQEGLEPGQLAEIERQEIRAMLEMQWKRVRRMKFVTAGTWILFAGLLIVLSAIDAGRQGRTPPEVAAAAFVMRAIGLIAVILTISYYVRYRAANMTEIRVRLSEIEAKLQKLAGN